MNWLIEYSPFIISIVLGLLSLIVGFVGKPKITDNVLTFIAKRLPDFINEAESKFGSGNGQAKFLYVYNALINYLIDSTGLKEKIIKDEYSLVITSMIEAVLSTPQKKEDLTNETKITKE